MVRQERAIRTREALIKSAAEAFHREGFTVASLTAISTRAGVSNGALHFHFASKAALADAVEEAALQRLQSVTRLSSATAEGCLQHLVDVSHALARGLVADVVLRAGFELGGDPARPQRTELRRQWRHWVERVLLEAARAGELRAGVTPDQAARAVVAAMVGFEVLGARDATWLRPPIISQFWQLLLPTLASRAVLATLVTTGTATVRQAQQPAGG
ncbi:ScbR family autoregulator-binding transcription factor [Streptomyces sp. NPDC059785]|uniref:ScbR family autoregulator-binding transcription factor n=1 Tax=unclassified Streptomyces TaxID=2593676 RepID=UPI003668E019